MVRQLGIAIMAAALATTAVAATDLPTRTTGVNRRDGKLLISVGAQDLLPREDRERLMSGFASRVLIRVELSRAGMTAPVALSFRHSEIVYDLWDETFHVRVTDPRNSTGEVKQAATVEEAIRLATALVAFPIVELASLAPGASYRLRFRADLNPLSAELLADVRRWLSRPPTSGRLVSGDSFFGSLVSFFVNPRIEQSERRVDFVSQSFVEPAR